MKVLLYAGLFAALILPVSESSACGDKFLVVGRNVKQGRARASVRPASILIYRHASSTLANKAMDPDLLETLKDVGHKVVIVDRMDEFAKMIGDSRYDIVVADVADAQQVKKQIAEKDSQAVVLPVTFYASNTELKATKREFKCVLDAPCRSSQALASVNDAMSLHR